MSQFAYNGIEISYIRTQTIDREPQYSDDGTEYLWTKVTVTVQGVVNAGDPSRNVFGIVPSLAGETTAQTMLRIQHYLEVPRGQLLFKIGGDLYIVSPAPIAGINNVPFPGANPTDQGIPTIGPGFVDANNGPFPRKLSITQIGGTQTFLVTYTIECAVVECPSGFGPPDYASHRYRSTTAIDENFYTKLTIVGTLICRADGNKTVDQLRGVVMPPIPDGFKRQSFDITVSEDGLRLTYTITDQEVYLQAPAPATKASGKLRETTNMAGMRVVECTVHLEGDANSSKPILIGTAALIVMNQLSLVDGAGNPTLFSSGIFEIGVIESELYESKITVTGRVKLRATPKRFKNLTVDLSQFSNVPIGSESTLPTRDPGLRGTAFLELVSNLFHDPCIMQSTLIPAGVGPSTLVGTTPAGATFTLSTGQVPQQDADSTIYADDPAPGVTTDYKTSHQYDAEQHIIALPVASNQPGAPSTAFIQLAAPQTKLTMDFEGEREGSRPRLPTTNLGNNAVLLSQTLSPKNVSVAGDGQSPIYRTRGRYEFGFKDETKVVPMHGVPPWLQAGNVGVQGANGTPALSAVDFQDNIGNPPAGGDPVLIAGNPAGPPAGGNVIQNNMQGN